MEKLKALHTHLASRNIFDENQLESWAEKVKVFPSGKARTVGLADMVGMQLGYIEYDAIFVIENYAGSAETIIAIVIAWLMENDNSRENDSLSDPVFDVDPHDDGIVDIEIHVPFSGDLNLVMDAAGAITIDGEQWSVATSTIYEAETANLVPVDSSGDPI